MPLYTYNDMNPVVNILIWITYFISLYFVIFWFLVFLDGGIRNKETKKLSKFPLVTIVIPAYNEEKRIKGTIESVLKLNYPKNKLEFIIVNDGSTDKTEHVARALIKDNKKFSIKLINQENKGKGAALNTALGISKGEFFVCLDADSFVGKDALKKILPHFNKKSVAAVLPLLKVQKPKKLLQKMQWFEYLVNMFYKRLMSKLDCVHVSPGPFSVYRKNILKKIGGFDEENLTEDLEVTLRLQNHHYRIIQLLDSDVYTVAPNSLAGLYKQRRRWYKGSIYNALRYRNMMFNKKYGDFGLIQMPIIIIAGIIAVILITSFVYYSFKPSLDYIYNMKFIGFDFMTLLKNFVFNFHILDINYTAVLVAIVMLVISIVILVNSHIYTREKIVKYGLFSLVVYLLFYFLLLGVIWIGIAMEMLLGIKQKW